MTRDRLRGIDVYTEMMEKAMKKMYPECIVDVLGEYDTIYGKANIVTVEDLYIYLKPNHPENKISVWHDSMQWDFNELDPALDLIHNIVIREIIY